MNLKKKVIYIFIGLLVYSISFSQATSFKKNKFKNIVSTPLQIDKLQYNLSKYFSSYKISTTTKSPASKINLMSKKISFSTIQSVINNDKVILDEDGAMPIYIEPAKQNNTSTILNEKNILGISRLFLNEKKSLLKINDPDTEFKLIGFQQDEKGVTHTRYQQVYQGIEIWAKDIYVHLDKYGNVNFLNGRFEQTPVGISGAFAKISQLEAISIAKNDLLIKRSIKELPENLKQLLDYSGPKVKQIIWYDKLKIPHLAYHVEIRPDLVQDWYYFIDSKTGFILNKYNNTKADGPSQASGRDLNGVTRTIGTYLKGGVYYLIDASLPMYDPAKSKIPTDPVGAIQCLDLKNNDFSENATLYYVTSNNNQWDALQISAQYNALTTFNYLKNTFNRNSIDNNGMSIFSLIHVTEQGQPMENAYWNGAFLCFGDGGSILKPWPGTLDLSAHEVIHGVTQYTANLEYQDQSGALNESMSDVFGAMAERKNWQLGEEIVKSFQYFPSGALRDISNPHNGGVNRYSDCWQPRDMSEFVSTTEDNGGVHVNSSIPSYAFYLVALNQSKEKAEKIWYKALSEYMTHSSQFIDARLLTIKAAEELYGKNSAEVNTVKAAWDDVKVFDGNGTTEPPITKVNGDDWILAYATQQNDPNSIYMVKSTPVSSSDFFPMTQTGVWDSRPAVSDNGKLILFIDDQNNLRAMASNPSAPQEQVIDNQGIWNSVAIGPGLNSIALTTKIQDGKIYIFDLVNKKVISYEMKIQSGDSPVLLTPKFADAMAFDQSGKYLIFDAYNEMKDNFGNIFGYWTLNMLEVSSGRMENVFASVPNVYSVGNPSFAKTMPTRITYDVLEESTGRVSIMTLDLNSGDIGLVATNLPFNNDYVIGYPSFSRDDKMIAYHTIVPNGSQFIDGIVKMTLKADLLNGTGYVIAHSTGSTMPTWFIIGTRVGIEDRSNLPISNALIGNYPNPFNPETTISFSLQKSNSVSLKIYNTLGQEVRTLIDNKTYSTGNNLISWDGKDNFSKNLSSGVYLYKLLISDFSDMKKMILVR